MREWAHLHICVLRQLEQYAVHSRYARLQQAEAAHDLRGTVSVIANASALVTSDTAADAARAQGSQLLRQNIASLRELLSDLMDQARLEAGQEQRKLATFDAGQLLREPCESLRGVAANRNLFMKSEGPQIDNNPAASHWIVCVQDTGPGFDAAPAAPLEPLRCQQSHSHPRQVT
jgi:signal transduction histidine kinase